MTEVNPARGYPVGQDHIVAQPRATDALGHALRGAFGDRAMPREMLALLHRLDHIPN